MPCLTHPDIQAVVLSAQPHAGQHIYSEAAGTAKRVQALAAPRTTVVVMPDADLEQCGRRA